MNCMRRSLEKPRGLIACNVSPIVVLACPSPVPVPERMVHGAVDAAHRWVSENTVRNMVEAEICLELFKRCWP